MTSCPCKGQLSGDLSYALLMYFALSDSFWQHNLVLTALFLLLQGSKAACEGDSEVPMWQKAEPSSGTGGAAPSSPAL